MPKKRLLERLADEELNPTQRGETSLSEIINSVVRHLSRILNTRQGSAQIDQYFGIPDFTSLSATFSEEMIPELEENLSAIISRYEPRLTRIHVTYEPKENSFSGVTFKMEASLNHEGRELPVMFETILSANGHLKIIDT